MRFFLSGLLCIFPVIVQADATVNIGGTLVTNGVLDLSTLRTDTSLALKSMLGMPIATLDSKLPKSRTGDAFADARADTEIRDRIIELAERFRALQEEFGYIAVEFKAVPLYVAQPNLSCGSKYLNGKLYEVGCQSVCGLPEDVSLYAGEIDPFPEQIHFDYPEMDWVEWGDCRSNTGAEEVLRNDGTGSITKLNKGYAFWYLFVPSRMIT